MGSLVTIKASKKKILRKKPAEKENNYENVNKNEVNFVGITTVTVVSGRQRKQVLVTFTIWEFIKPQLIEENT